MDSKVALEHDAEEGHLCFNQKGLMGGLGLQGTKITEYTPSA